MFPCTSFKSKLTSEQHMNSCLILPWKHVYICNIKSSTTCHGISWEHNFLPCYPFWLEPRKTLCLAWTATLSCSLPFPISTLGEKWNFTAGKMYKVSFSTQETYCQPFCDLLGNMFLVKYLCKVVCLKRWERGICHKRRKSLAELLLTSAEDTRNVSAVWRKSMLLCNQWGIQWGGNRSRGFMNLIRKFYLDLTLLWCLSVVSATRVRYRKCFVTSMVCASRQPLHWAAPSAGAQWH